MMKIKYILAYQEIFLFCKLYKFLLSRKSIKPIKPVIFDEYANELGLHYYDGKYNCNCEAFENYLLEKDWNYCKILIFNSDTLNDDLYVRFLHRLIDDFERSYIKPLEREETINTKYLKICDTIEKSYSSSSWELINKLSNGYQFIGINTPLPPVLALDRAMWMKKNIHNLHNFSYLREDFIEEFEYIL